MFLTLDCWYWGCDNGVVVEIQLCFEEVAELDDLVCVLDPTSVGFVCEDFLTGFGVP